MLNRKFVTKHTASNGKAVVMGFCWGGSQTFRYATHSNVIEAAVVFYGSPPDSEDSYSSIDCPVYGFYGENDARINSTIENTEKLRRENNLVYNYVIYPGAGHAFMRRGDDPDGDEINKKARDRAFERLVGILNEIE